MTPKVSYAFPIIAFVIVLLSGLAYYLYQRQQASILLSNTNPAAITNPITPSQIKLPSGKQTYRFNHGSNVVGPKMQSVTINPLDPQNGDTQTITVEMGSSSLLTKAIITIYTDNKQKEIGLKFVSGDLENGIYQGSWAVNDTYEKRYAFRYILTDSSGTYDNTMSPR